MAVDDVVAGATEQQIAARITGDDVVAGPAVDDVIPRPARDRVVAAVAEDPVSPRPARDDVAAIIGAPDDVVAGAARERVAGATTAADLVVSGAARDDVGSESAVEQVVAGATQQGVVALAAGERDRAREGGGVEHVVAETAGQRGALDAAEREGASGRADQARVGQREVRVVRGHHPVDAGGARERREAGPARDVERVVAGPAAQARFLDRREAEAAPVRASQAPIAQREVGVVDGHEAVRADGAVDHGDARIAADVEDVVRRPARERDHLDPVQGVDTLPRHRRVGEDHIGVGPLDEHVDAGATEDLIVARAHLDALGDGAGRDIHVHGAVAVEVVGPALATDHVIAGPTGDVVAGLAAPDHVVLEASIDRETGERAARVDDVAAGMSERNAVDGCDARDTAVTDTVLRGVAEHHQR